VDADGYDDIILWEAPEVVTLRQPWWDLLDWVQHVLLFGPIGALDDAAVQKAATAGELMATVVRARFW
jgi:hypothetical protein